MVKFSVVDAVVSLLTLNCSTTCFYYFHFEFKLPKGENTYETRISINFAVAVVFVSGFFFSFFLQINFILSTWHLPCTNVKLLPILFITLPFLLFFFLFFFVFLLFNVFHSLKCWYFTPITKTYEEADLEPNTQA